MWVEINNNQKGENLMDHINRIELQGRVGNVRTNEHNGTRVANFSLATDLLYRTKDGNAVSETTWHNIVAWESKDTPNVHEICVGMPLNVIGRLRTSRYTTADGTEKIFYEVLASKIRVIEEDTSQA